MTPTVSQPPSCRGTKALARSYSPAARAVSSRMTRALLLTWVTWMFPAPDGALLAYGSSPNGSEMSMLKVLNVVTGAHLSDTITRTRVGTVAGSLRGRPSGTSATREEDRPARQ